MISKNTLFQPKGNNLAVPCQKKQTQAAPRRKYDETFKTKAVRLITAGNRSVPDVARSLGISENLLYNWKNKTKADKQPSGISQEEHDRLKEQLRRTEQERDILKSVDSAGPVEWPR